MIRLNSDFIINHEIGIAVINGKYRVFFTEERLLKDEVPEGLFRYQVRMSDDGEQWSTIENFVVVNFAATILSEKKLPLEMHEDGGFYLNIKNCDADYDPDWMSYYEERLNEQITTFGQNKNELFRECTAYLNDVLEHQPDQKVILKDDETENGVYVTYDGGNHPEYAAYPWSEVRAVSMSEVGIVLHLEEDDRYELDRINSIDEIVKLTEAVMSRRK